MKGGRKEEKWNEKRRMEMIHFEGEYTEKIRRRKRRKIVSRKNEGERK